MKNIKTATVFFLVMMMLPTNLFATSLWNNSRGSSLFTDAKARDIGDIVTIVISETASFNKQGKTDTDKAVSMLTDVVSFLYPEAQILTEDNTGATGIKTNKGYTGSRLGMRNGVLPHMQWGSSKEFSGGGSIQNKDAFTAKVTARIIDVLPNGYMLLEGTKTLNVSNESQTIIVTGKVRPVDISPENTIMSERIADFEVFYQGSGPVNDNQKRGLLTKLWDKVGIF